MGMSMRERIRWGTETDWSFSGPVDLKENLEFLHDVYLSMKYLNSRQFLLCPFTKS